MDDIPVGPARATLLARGAGKVPASEKSSVIAIVDDDQMVRGSMESLIRSLGLEARSFGSAEEFLGADDRSFQCIITDVQMPGMGGRELQLIVSEWEAPIPTIAMSAFPEAGDAMVAAGAVCFIAKPIDGETLVTCLERVLGPLD